MNPNTVAVPAIFALTTLIDESRNKKSNLSLDPKKKCDNGAKVSMSFQLSEPKLVVKSYWVNSY